jgi:hypothetical protein
VLPRSIVRSLSLARLFVAHSLARSLARSLFLFLSHSLLLAARFSRRSPRGMTIRQRRVTALAREYPSDGERMWHDVSRANFVVHCRNSFSDARVDLTLTLSCLRSFYVSHRCATDTDARNRDATITHPSSRCEKIP